MLGRVWAKRIVSEQVWFIPKTAGGLDGGSVVTSDKRCNFYPQLRLKIVFPALELPLNYYINMSIGPPNNIYVSEKQPWQTDKI